MNDKIEVFPIYNRENACKAVEIMHKLFTKIEKNPEAARIYYAFEQLVEHFETKQTEKNGTPAHLIVQEILVARGISNRDFSALIKTSETALSAILAGSRPISDRMAQRIGDALSIDPNAIRAQRSQKSA